MNWLVLIITFICTIMTAIDAYTCARYGNEKCDWMNSRIGVTGLLLVMCYVFLVEFIKQAIAIFG